MATEKETTLKEIVRPRMKKKMDDLVDTVVKCEKIHDDTHDDALLATTTRFNSHGDIYSLTQEISRYITVDNMFTSNQRQHATQARDSLRAATNALAAMRMTDAVTRVKEAQKAFSEI